MPRYAMPARRFMEGLAGNANATRTERFLNEWSGCSGLIGRDVLVARWFQMFASLRRGGVKCLRSIVEV